MTQQRRIGVQWNLRSIMAQRGLWKTTDLLPLLKSRGINLSASQVYRLVTTTPERLPTRTFVALCDLLECTPNDLIEPVVEMKATRSVNAPDLPETGTSTVRPQAIAHRIRLVENSDGASP